MTSSLSAASRKRASASRSGDAEAAAFTAVSSLSLEMPRMRAIWVSRTSPAMVVLALLHGAGFARLDAAVAGRAVHGALTPRHEGHLGHLATVGAGGRVHLARGLAAEAGKVAVADVAVVLLEGALAGAARGTARGAPRGLVHEPLVRVELLLATGENERIAAVAACDLLVSKSQVKRTPSSASNAGCTSSVAQGPRRSGKLPRSCWQAGSRGLTSPVPSPI